MELGNASTSLCFSQFQVSNFTAKIGLKKEDEQKGRTKKTLRDCGFRKSSHKIQKTSIKRKYNASENHRSIYDELHRLSGFLLSRWDKIALQERNKKDSDNNDVACGCLLGVQRKNKKRLPFDKCGDRAVYA
ncbi:MAG: hypothetical protein U9Q89_03650 [Thermodesulfobacteriota bacterium]|nr:hypothetical protein [Thermodesulfobacteriota bacterium]